MRKFSLIILAIFFTGCGGCGQERFKEPIFPKYGTHSSIVKVDIPVDERPSLGETSLFVYAGELFRVAFKRHVLIGQGEESVLIERYNDLTMQFDQITELTWNRSLGSALLTNGRLYIFGTHDFSPGNSIFMQEIDLTTWQFIGPDILVFTAPAGQIIYNTSVTEGPDGYVLMYENDEGRRFSDRFLRSDDLATWEPIGGLANGGHYSGGPFLTYVSDGWYILSYLRIVAGGFETVVSRTQDFITFETAEAPFLGFDDPSEGINLSDVDFIEYDGRVFFTYQDGDQRTWYNNGYAWFNGTLQDLYDLYWP